jgi:hypothetical protein
MKLRGLGLQVLLASALLGPAAGCAPYRVVQQSVSPSALRGVRDVTVSFDWTQVRLSGKSEAEYVAEKTAEERGDFVVIKTEIDGAILQALRDQVGPPYTFTVNSAPPVIGELRVVVQHAEIETGIFSFVYNKPTRVLTRLLWIRDGKVTDIIDASASVQSSVTTASDHQRMPMAGKVIGKAAAHYFIEAQHAR